MKKVTEIPATIFPKVKDTKAKLNVAAYCRVSTESEKQEIVLKPKENIIRMKSKGILTGTW